jgi:hypothetical protein
MRTLTPSCSNVASKIGSRRVDGGAQPAIEAHDVARAAAIEPPRDRADDVARGERRAILGRRLRDELGVVRLEPKLALALRQRQQLGLR